MARTIICVLKSGGEYTAKHVQALAKQLPNLVCLSDVNIEGVDTLPLLYNYPGWWSKMEMFRPDIPGDVFFIDLDTIVTADICEMINVGKTTMLKDFYQPRLASGLMYITEADRAKVWAKWKQNPAWHMTRCGNYGDQMLIGEVLHDAATWQALFPNQVISYKADFMKDNSKINGAKVVCFHGKPRPWAVKLEWIPDYG